MATHAFRGLIIPDRLGLGKLSGAKYPGPSNLPQPTSIPLPKLLGYGGGKTDFLSQDRRALG